VNIKIDMMYMRQLVDQGYMEIYDPLYDALKERYDDTRN